LELNSLQLAANTYFVSQGAAVSLIFLELFPLDEEIFFIQLKLLSEIEDVF
jgi:hypothetical protein